MKDFEVCMLKNISDFTLANLTTCFVLLTHTDFQLKNALLSFILNQMLLIFTITIPQIQPFKPHHPVLIYFSD